MMITSSELAKLIAEIPALADCVWAVELEAQNAGREAHGQTSCNRSREKPWLLACIRKFRSSHN
jgi:hypothetical protein